MRRMSCWRRWDVLPIALCLLLAVGMGVWSQHRTAGQRVRITTPTEEAVFPLSEDREITVNGRDGYTLVIGIENGEAFVKTADCPDHVCIKAGRLSRSGQSAACLPAGVMLTVEGDGRAPDAVAR